MLPEDVDFEHNKGSTNIWNFELFPICLSSIHLSRKQKDIPENNVQHYKIDQKRYSNYFLTTFYLVEYHATHMNFFPLMSVLFFVKLLL